MKDFKPELFLIDALKEKNIRNIRVALSTYITKDAGDEDGEISNAVKYAENNYSEDIWQVHDNREQESKDNWNTAYLGLLQSDLMHNFSQERFNHILEVGKFVYPKKSKTISKDHNNTRDSEPSPTRPSTTGKQNSRQRISVVKKKDPMGKYLIPAGAIVVGMISYLILKH